MNSVLNSISVITVRCLLISMVLVSFSCKSKKRMIEVDPGFGKYIQAYTSGTISKKSVIRIQLSSEVTISHTVNEAISEKLFSFTPSVNGKAYWVDANTIEFKPDKDLEVDKEFEATFSLSKLLNVPPRFEAFHFYFKTTKPSIEVIENGLKSVGKDAMIFTGEILTADVESSASIERILQATLEGRALSIKWQHNESANSHGFVIENIPRIQKSQNLLLFWDGANIKASQKDQKQIEVPAQGEFKVMGVKVSQEDEQYTLVQFSEPISKLQNLEGLITISNIDGVGFSVIGSEVKVVGSGRLEGNYTVNIKEGILSEWGTKLEKQFTGNIFFENRLPMVKIHGMGSILPATGSKIVLPFDAVNLNAVDITIIKIFENNIPQFLQSNSLQGDNDLRRTAMPIVKTTIRLDNDKSLNLHKKNRFSINLDNYIVTEPGAIYRIGLGFRPEYSLYTCSSGMMKSNRDDEEDNDYYERNSDDQVDGENDFWSTYDSYYPFGYNWEQRDNPCSRSYFNKSRFDFRNIIATNIGLTAKRGANNSLLVAVNNLVSTEPMNGVSLRVLDYQQQIVGSASTGSNGIAIVEVKRKPFLLIASYGKEKSYLKLDDGSSLPLSRFDVGGSEVKNGIKGFIFGERGVWRPGDSLFLGCVIEDRESQLPKEHPIEMELYSPKGQLYKRLVNTNSSDGFTVFKTVTDAAAPTGNWLCKVKVGGAVFEKGIKIETVMPNRLKIDLNFNGATFFTKNNNNATLSAKWLFGAPARNLKTKVDVQLYKRSTIFDKFKEFTFDNPTATFESQSKTIFEGSLNSEGVASINPAMPAGNNAPGMLLANLMVKVFEPGGNFSIDNVSMPFHPYESYIGIRSPEGDKQWGYLLSGKTHPFDIVQVTPEGKLHTGSSEVNIELYKIQWRWWWDNSGDDMSNFSEDNYNKLIKRERVQMKNGQLVYRVSMGEEDYGRYLMLVTDLRSGHKTGKIFYVNDNFWQSRVGGNDQGAASMLTFSSDKSKYNVGEKIALTIPSSKGGRALISIESGRKIIKTFWVETKQGETKFDFNAEKEMSPNIYVNVSLFQPHAQTQNDLPIRMYGILPIIVEDKNTVLHPLIQMPDVITPESPQSVVVSERDGKSMQYVIAIVDEGLLDLTRFKTPNPQEFFYAKEALGIKSWDLYDNVIGAWGGEIERMLTIGGDADGELSAKTRKANRFKPVVKFLGPFKSSGSGKHTFQLPSYMGSVRVMVIASGKNNSICAYGMAEKSVVVKKPLLLLATLPRVLGPDEQVTIPVTVFATQAGIKQVKVSVRGSGFSEIMSSQSVLFSSPGEQVVYVPARVSHVTGIGKVKIQASGGGQTAAYETEIEIRNPQLPITQSSEATLEADKTMSKTISIIGSGSSSKAFLEISTIPALNLQKRLEYLIQYPHGCIEQTVSAAFPQLYLNSLMNLEMQQKTEVEKNIRKAIVSVQNFQTADGGFSYWPGGSVSDEWGTNYAGHFLLEASAKGYTVSSQLLQQWKENQRSKAQAWNVSGSIQYDADLVQAYRLFLLALAKSPEMGAMNRLKELKGLRVEAKWRLAAAYYLSGQQTIALQLISGLPTRFPAKQNWGITYGSSLRDEAMVLETLTIMNRRLEAGELVKSIAINLAADTWLSTQTTAYGLLSIAKFCGINKDGNKIKADIKINGKLTQITSENVLSQSAINWNNGKASVEVMNSGNNVLYARIINQGQPFTNQIIPIQNNPNILKVTVSYFKTTGESLDITNIKQGTDFVAKVTINNPGLRGDYSQMALTQSFPSGWEILNTRLYNSEGAFKSSNSDYLDIRDDRVSHYFMLRQKETATYFVQLNAAYLGKYFYSGAYVEAMYDNSISGGVSGKWVEVSK